MHSETTNTTWFYELLAWVEVNKKRVLIGLGLAAALGLAIYIYAWQREQTELAANRALLELRAIGGEDQRLANATDFLKVARSYTSTRAGERALLLAAGDLFTGNRYPEAQAEFEKFLGRYGDSSLAPIAALGVAACLDAQDKIDAAMTAYQDVVTRFPGDPVVVRARMGIAGLHEVKNQPELALKIYQDISKLGMTSRSAVAGEAYLRLQQLQQKFPNLARTNASPAGLLKAFAPATPPKLVPTNAAPAKGPAAATQSKK